MDRREFVKRSAFGGVAVVAGGLIDASAALAAPKPQYLGYRVGDTAADFAGYDQYMRQSKLSDNRGYWTLIDLCPLWCVPCNLSAMQHKSFSDFVNSNGIPFRMQPVVVEALQTGTPSSRLDAEKWAVGYGLEKFNVLHDNGDPNSPLRQLFSSYGAANGNSAPGYPTYVLVDPAGKIQQYLVGDDQLDQVQSFLAAQTHKALNHGAWLSIDNNRPVLDSSYGVFTLTSGAATFHLWDGTPVSDSGTFSPTSFTTTDASYTTAAASEPFPAIDAVLEPIGPTLVINLWDVLGETITIGGDGNTIEDHSKLVDLHSPITITAGQDVVPQFSRTYNRLSGTAGVAFMEKDPTFYQSQDGTSGTLGSVGTTLIRNANGTLTIGPFTPSDTFDNGTWQGVTDTDRASNVMTANFTYSKIEPYQAAIDLEATVNNDPALSNQMKKAVAGLLEGGRSKMASRDFASAAKQFAKAEATLQGASANPAEIDKADWITAHVTWLSTH